MHCDPTNPWLDGDFTPCFRQRFVNQLLINATVLISVIFVSISALKHFRQLRRTHNKLHASLINDNHNTTRSYGTVSGAQPEILDETDALQTETKACRWSIFTISRLFVACAQIAIFSYTIEVLVQKKYNLSKNESSESDVYLTNFSHILFWTYSLILSAVNFWLSKTPNDLADLICKHLNGLYFIDLFLNLLNISSNYHTYKTNISGLGYSISVLSALFDIVIISVIIHEARHAPDTSLKTLDGRIMSGENWPSLYSKITFSWVSSTMKEGYKHDLDDVDIKEVPTEKKSMYTLKRYHESKFGSSIILSLLRMFYRPLLLQAVYCVTYSCLQIVPLYFLNRVIKYIENPGEEPATTAYLYVIGMFIANCSHSLILHQLLDIGRTMAVRIQSIVISEVFSKSLRLQDNSQAQDSLNGVLKENSQSTGSNVNNLISVDTLKIGEMVSYFCQIYTAPFQIGISIWCLYILLGNSALWSILIMVIYQPIIFLLGSHFQRLQDRVMNATDHRLKIMSELLSSIRTIKLFAWEGKFRQRLNKAREAELKAIKSRLMALMWITNSGFFLPVVISLVVFYGYTRDHVLDPAVAFTSLAFFNYFRNSFNSLPGVLSLFLQGIVSIKRVESYLQQEEIITPIAQAGNIQNAKENKEYVTVGFINDATFSWVNPSRNNKVSQNFMLKDLNISFPSQKVSIICGPTGSGKTTLLASLLGETHCVSGQAVLPRMQKQQNNSSVSSNGIAYVSQTAWIQNCTIRDNILFGLPFDKKRYENTLFVTALIKDLDTLEFGDQTEIGERGVNLSGGQKQRVSIARAVYSQAHTVILDDCLSAIDSNTAKHIYDYCIMGSMMKGRTTVLVTNHLGLCLKSASYVVVLEEGRIKFEGSPLEIIDSNILSEDLFRASDGVDDILNAMPDAIPDSTKDTNKTDINTPKNIDGKLIKEEEHAKGATKLFVYQSYIKSSNGYFFWFIIISLFILVQGSSFLQDYWIKIWSAAYENNSGNPLINSYSSFSKSFYYYLKYPLSDLESHFFIQKVNDKIDILYYIKIYFYIGVLGLLLATLRSLFLFSASIKASWNIHSQLLESILQAKVRFFDTTPIGRIMNRFSTDLGVIDQEVAPTFSDFLSFVASSTCVLVLVSWIIPAFILPGIIITFMFYIVSSYYLATSQQLKRLNSVARSPINSQFTETLNGLTTIRAYGCQKRFIIENYKRIDNCNRSLIWFWATNRWMHVRVEALGEVVVLCNGLFLLMARDWVDPGLLGLSLSYSLTFTYRLIFALRYYAMNEMNMNALERAYEYTLIEQESPAIIHSNTPKPSWPETGRMEVKDLTIKYDPEYPAVLKGISFETRPREKIGIVGRTGSGKSTLALSIFRFVEPTNGTIKIDNVDIHTVRLHDLRSRIAIIPQDPVLFSGTIRSNLDPFNEHSDVDLWAALKRSHLIEKDKKISDDKNQITLDSPVNENGSNWSQGQRQLITLARALVNKSRLIILDEATSAIDFERDRKIQETIRSEFTSSSLLCIAHRLRTIIDYDRVMVLDQGEVIEFDTPYNLIQENGVFRSMCEKSGEFDMLLSMATASHKPKN